jgi:DNA-binding transcriptional regulator YdaS (Cro superfamily)
MIGMTDSDLIDKLGGTATVARRLAVAPASVSEWRQKGIPAGRRIELGADIERATGVPRWHLRPHDWHRIWPELIGTEGAPPVPAEAVRDAA